MAKNEFTKASPVVNLTAASGTLEENKAYYIALPEQKLSQGLTLCLYHAGWQSYLEEG